MAAFDRDNVTRNETLGIPARKTNTPAWIAGIVVLAVVVLGAYGYESGMWGTHAGIVSVIGLSDVVRSELFEGLPGSASRAM